MADLIKIAVDAMGGDNSPKKVIDGIIHNHKNNRENFFKIFGDKNKIISLLNNQIESQYYEIIHTENSVLSTDSPLEAAKRGKDTSMWLSIESVKKKEADIVISAGNTGALLVISKLNLKMVSFFFEYCLIWFSKLCSENLLKCFCILFGKLCEMFDFVLVNSVL